MTVKDSVLEALQASRDDFLSGESLSATLDVSRAAVWKAIKNSEKRVIQSKRSQTKAIC